MPEIEISVNLPIKAVGASGANVLINACVSLQIALKCADISNPCRPWSVCKKWSQRVCDEFFKQGDSERELSLPVSSLCDRFKDTIPKIQTGTH